MSILHDFRHYLILAPIIVIGIFIYTGELFGIEYAREIALGCCIVIALVYYLVYINIQQPVERKQEQQAPAPQQQPHTTATKSESPMPDRDIFRGFN